MKWTIALLFLAVPLFAGPTVVPSTPTVYMGNQIQFTSTDTVTWSMYPGSVGTVSAGGLYTAPSSFQAKNIVAGCPILPNDHIYNVDITSLPVDTNSATRISNVGTTGHLDFTEASMPINVMNNATPTIAQTFFYTTSNNGKSFPILPAPYTGVENSLYPADYFAQDRHQLGINTDSCQATEIYNEYPAGTNIPQSCPTCTAQSGVQYGPMSYQLANGDGATDAAGMYLLPLLMRYSELKAGSINHALRFTLANGFSYNGFLWPATNLSNQCQTLSTCFPFGSRLRLKASYDDSALSPTQRIVTKALKKYGMFMADIGTSLHIESAADVFQDTVTYAALDAFRSGGPTFGNFEQVDESSLEISSASGRVQVANGFKVIPDNYSIIISTKNSDGTATYTYVALQPVTVGWKNTPFPVNTAALSVMAGTPAFQIPFWVNGATTTTASCSMSPTYGTLTSGCVYTAPASVPTISSAVVTITATGVVDSTGTVSFPLIVFSSDAIRVNIGGKASAISSPSIPYDAAGNYGPDALGAYWWSDPVGNMPTWYGLDDESSPQSNWPSSTDVGLYYTHRHGLTDSAWSAMVPNGNYTLTLKFGTGDANEVKLSSVTIDTQNTVILTTATTPVSATYTPTDKTAKIQVKNNQFYFAIRQIYNGDFPFLNAWKLNYDSPLSGSPISINGKVSIKGKVNL